MKTRKVLTVNQTFEILLKWVGSRDWEKALFDVVPKRKFQEGAKSKGDHEDKKTEEVEAVTAVEKVIVDEEMLREATPDVKGKGSDNFEPLSATDVHVQDTPVTGTDPS